MLQNFTENLSRQNKDSVLPIRYIEQKFAASLLESLWKIGNSKTKDMTLVNIFKRIVKTTAEPALDMSGIPHKYLLGSKR